MAKSYGKTWWGLKWLDSLKQIDNTNRLPRGRTYANTGKVYDIQIDGNLISAKVKGNYAAYYNVKIMLKSFNSNDKQIIIEIVNNSSSILSSLMNNKLPVELYNKLSQSGIEIFPKKWGDLNGDCNCPDYAVPCKHIAGLIYMVSTEIDKDPFTAFKMHNCDLLYLLPCFNESTKDKRVKSLNDIFLKEESRSEKLLRENINKGEVVNKEETLDNIDFSNIPDLFQHNFMLLKSKPLFYERDFKEITKNIYKTLKKKSDNNININLPKKLKKSRNKSFENEQERIEYEFNSLWGDIPLTDNFKIDIDSNYNINKILNQDNIDYFKNYKEHLSEAFAGFILNIPNLGKYSYTTKFLYFLGRFARELLRKSAFIPEIIETEDNNVIVRWVLSLFGESLNKIYNEFIETCPDDLLTYNGKKIDSKEQVKTVLSLILSNMIYSLVNDNPTLKISKEFNNPVFRLFYMGEKQAFSNFETKSYKHLIMQWISNLNIRERNYNLYLVINERNESFTIDLEVSFDDDPELVYDFIANKKNYKQIDKKLELLSDIHLIENHLPKLGGSIDAQKPMEFGLDDFSDFFMDIMPLLEIMGISIILPKSLEKTLKPRLTLQLKSKSIDKNEMGYLSFRDLISFDYEIHIGGEVITEAEFRKLLDKSEKLVKIANEYVVLDETEIKSILKKLNKPLKLNNNELLQATLTEEYEDLDIELDKNLSKIVEQITNFETLNAPDNLDAKLRPYQLRGFSWLMQNIKTGFGSILADDMGLGKTIQVLTLILYLKNNNLLNNKKILIITPTSLLSNWKKEIERFTPSLSSHIYHGSDRHFKEDFDILLSSYGLVRQDEEKFKKYKWFLMVIDEAQNIKNPQTQQTKSVKSIKSDHKIALTGTPLENRLLDYWSIFDFTNKQYLGNNNKFKENYITPIEKNRNKSKLEQFKKITSPFILRRLKTDKSIIKDLPEKIENNVYCKLTPEQTALYQKSLDTIMENIENSDGMQHKGLVLKLINNLKQICNHPSQFKKKKIASIDESGKMQVLIELLKNIEENSEKVLVFTQYAQMGNIIKKVVEEELNMEVDFLHGKQSRKTRDKIVDDFNTNPQKKILILSLKAGGTGLNLTAVNNVIHYDLWWNPAVESQATDRTYRIGQKRNVMVYRLITIGTFEEKINDMIQGKKELAEITVGENESFITEFSNNELKEILKLRD
jgi:SNF2 family DNA or RNA helicase/uncharacterized Zn finger protein